MKRSTFSVLFYINRTKIRRDGMCQLLCKISIDGFSEQIGTKVSVSPELWNSSNGRSVGKSRNSLEINAFIDKFDAQIKTHYSQIRNSLGYVTAELVKNAINGVAQKPLTLMKLFDEHNSEFFQRVGVDRGKAAYGVYLCSQKHLSAFLQKNYDEDIALRSITSDFYDAYDLFLRTERGLKQCAVSGHLIILKKMMRRAVGQGTLKRDPFHNLSPQQPPKVSRHTSLAELERVMSCAPPRENLRRVRDWFVFSTFTGLAYADLRRLSEENIVFADDGSQWIEMKRQKTGTEFRVRLTEIPLQIIEKYRSERIDARIFNTYARGYMYKLIDKLGRLCGIEHLTFHRARHNFGTHITLSMGVPIETVSRMMGHKSISTTQIYAKVTDRKVDEDMRRLRVKMRSDKKSETV